MSQAIAFDNFPELERPGDLAQSIRFFGASCGPISLAATLGVNVFEIMKFFPDFERKGYVNCTDMSLALELIGAEFEASDLVPLECGLALVQIDGPWRGNRWTELKFTHWIALRSGMAFDYNYMDWLDLVDWGQAFRQGLLEDVPEATGWSFRNLISVAPRKFRFDPLLDPSQIDRSYAERHSFRCTPHRT